MIVRLNLYDFDITAILSWHEYVNRYTVNDEESDPYRQQEQALVNKLEDREDRLICFTEREIEIMCSWMDRAIVGKYGDAVSLFGYERRIYAILKSKEGVPV